MEQENNNKIIPEEKRSHGCLWVAMILITILLSSIFGAVFGFMSGGIAQKMLPSFFQKVLSKNQNVEIIKQNIVQEDSAVIDVVEKSSPAVVSIVVSKDVSARGISPFDQFFGITTPGSGQNGTTKQTVGEGSGFLITTDGMIVTNKHVVSDETAEYTVVTNDSQKHPAKVLARDPINDIAILKIEGSDLPILALGDSDNLKVGQTTIAIGNSLGEFANTVSRGIISGLGRNVVAGSPMDRSERLNGIIQTDAAINSGNSGGPLLNIGGEVIGINVAIVQGAQNIGFALPANQIKKVVDQVKATGKISTPYLGVRYIPIDSQIQKANNLDYNYGVIIKGGQLLTDLAVIPGSPADKAGLVENDIILEIDGKKIDQDSSLTDLISKYDVDDEVMLKISHKGEEKTVKVKLEERKN